MKNKPTWKKQGTCWVITIDETTYTLRRVMASGMRLRWVVEDNFGAVWGDFASLKAAKLAVETYH